MTVKDIAQKLNFKIVAGENGVDNNVQGAYICDLLSWVMSHAQRGNIWITVQTNVNIIAVALLTEVSCVIIPEDIKIDEQTIIKANAEQIPLLTTSLNSYEIVSLLNKEMLV